MLTKETYYADEWMDEMPGVAGDLATVAGQLANGVEHEPGDWIVEPQAIPSKHKATMAQYSYVPCQREGLGNYVIPDDLPGEPHALAFYEGGGWTPEMMVDDLHGAQRALHEYGDQPVEWLVCIIKEATGILHLSDGPTATFEPVH